jgi:hypothetical protein
MMPPELICSGDPVQRLPSIGGNGRFRLILLGSGGCHGAIERRAIGGDRTASGSR